MQTLTARVVRSQTQTEDNRQLFPSRAPSRRCDRRERERAGESWGNTEACSRPVSTFRAIIVKIKTSTDTYEIDRTTTNVTRNPGTW